MASRPTPYSIALSALIVLHIQPAARQHQEGGGRNNKDEPPSPFLCRGPKHPDLVDAFLQDTLLRLTSCGSGAGLDEEEEEKEGDRYSHWLLRKQHDYPVSVLVDRMSKRLGDDEDDEDFVDSFICWLQVSSNSIDAMIDLVTACRRSVSSSSGVAAASVDPKSLYGTFLRGVCLGFDQLSFESVSLLWNEFRAEVADAATAPKAPSDRQQHWPLSSERMEGVLYHEILRRLQQHPSPLEDQEERDVLNSVLETHPELPNFLQFCYCLQTGEREGGVDALHRYLDYALIGNRTNNDATDNNDCNNEGGSAEILQFAAILAAALHYEFGDKALALVATEEAVRVAQQSHDPSCVAFALGWLSLLQSQGTLTAPSSDNGTSTVAVSQELMRRCAQRAVAAEGGDLRVLAAGANMMLATTANGSGDGYNGGNSPATAWSYLARVLSDGDNVSVGGGGRGGGVGSTGGGGWSTSHDGTSVYDRPTRMAHLACGTDALAIMARQRLVAAGIWDSYSQTLLSALSSGIALRCHASSSVLQSNDVSVAIQNIARCSVLGFNGSGGGTADINTTTIGAVQVKKESKSPCAYAEAIDLLVSLRQRFNLPSLPKQGGPFLYEIALVLHEWVVRRGDLDRAEILGAALESHLCPRLANLDSVYFDVMSQKCLRLGRQGLWEQAKSLLVELISSTACHGRQRARLLLQLAMLQLDSCPAYFARALPAILECLTIAESHNMNGLHAVALSILGHIHLRMGNPKRAIAVIRASLPTILRHEHVWFQGESYLTLSKSYLQQSKSLANGNYTKLVRKLLRSALKELLRSEQLFLRCEDCLRLREVYYLQARVYNSLSNCQSQRDMTSTKFVTVSRYLSNSPRNVNGYTAGEDGGGSIGIASSLIDMAMDLASNPIDPIAS